MAEPAPAEEDGPTAAPQTEVAPTSEEVLAATEKETAQTSEEAAPAAEAVQPSEEAAAAPDTEAEKSPEPVAAEKDGEQRAEEVPASAENEDAKPAEEAPTAPDTQGAKASEEAPAAAENEDAQPLEEAPAAAEKDDAQPLEEAPAAAEKEDTQPLEEVPAAPETEAAQSSEEVPAAAQQDDAPASAEVTAVADTDVDQIGEEVAASAEKEDIQPPEEATATGKTEDAQPSDEAPAEQEQEGAEASQEVTAATEQEVEQPSQEVPAAAEAAEESGAVVAEGATQGDQQGSDLLTPTSDAALTSQEDTGEAKVEIVKVGDRVVNIEAPAGSEVVTEDGAVGEDALQGKLLTPTSGVGLEQGLEHVTPTSEGGYTSILDPPEDKEAHLIGELAHVRSIGRTLESYRTGQDRSELPSAWEDPDYVAQEMADLKRVRRQIRYLFGGMLGTMQEASPADTTLRVDDLLSERGSPEPPRQAAPATSLGRPPPGIADPRIAQAAPSESPPMHRRHGRPPPAPGARIPIAPEGPRASTESPAVGRPRSGHTELSSDASSSVTWESQKGHEKGEDAEQRKERKERRHHRRHRHRQVSADPDFSRAEAPRPEESRHRQVSADPEYRYDAQRWDAGRGKRDDGAPPKQWNWAEEVMKASLDPENQWDFQVPNGRRGASPPPVPASLAIGGSLPAWEKPRAPGVAFRGKDVALKTRERAEEVMRDEREKQRQLLMFDHPQSGARHRSHH